MNRTLNFVTKVLSRSASLDRSEHDLDEETGLLSCTTAHRPPGARSQFHTSDKAECLFFLGLGLEKKGAFFFPSKPKKKKAQQVG